MNSSSLASLVKTRCAWAARSSLVSWAASRCSTAALSNPSRAIQRMIAVSGSTVTTHTSSPRSSQSASISTAASRTRWRAGFCSKAVRIRSSARRRISGHTMSVSAFSCLGSPKTLAPSALRSMSPLSVRTSSPKCATIWSSLGCPASKFRVRACLRR